MNLILSADQTQKMSSKEISELTNKKHSDVMRDIRKLSEQIENEPECTFALGEYVDLNNQKRPMYILSKKETLLLMSGYNPTLRLKIINRWEQLETKQPKLPTNYKEALIALVEAEEQKEQLLLQNENLNTALDNLLEWVSILKIARHNKIKETYFNWRKLKSNSIDMGYSIKKAESPRYGYQNLYNVNVFKMTYPELNYNF